MTEPILVTGAAGFIGHAIAKHLLARGDRVIGVDNLNAYYDPALKRARLADIGTPGGFEFLELDLADRNAVADLFKHARPKRVVHMAAQAGVRYSLSHPFAYVDANLAGFLTVLEGCRASGCEHLVYASSSSVYGGNTSVPFSETDNVDHPVSLYAATKKANELMAHTYAHLYGIPATGLRFFTVYGPWGRPDMAPVTFSTKLLRGEPIKLFNHGHHRRDFTYIDDIVEGVTRVLDRPVVPDPGYDPASPNPATSASPHRIYNIGHGEPLELMAFVAMLEAETGCTSTYDLLPMQPGDVLATHADVSALTRDTGFVPRTTHEDGVRRLVAWVRDYYGL